MGSVGSLVFNGWVPPRVHMNDVICGGEIEPKATRLQADQEEIALSGLEGIDTYFSLFCAGATV